MAVLIPIDMPKNCCECPVNWMVCNRGFEYLLHHTELYNKRADDCPIKEIHAPKNDPEIDKLLEESNFEL